jgi:DNA-binding NtrC family response regulator
LDILVVDDDAEHAEIVATALRSRYPALKVEVARHVAEAIEKTLEDERPSLVLAEYKVSEKDGQSLGNVIKQAYRKGIQVLMMAEPRAGGLIGRHVDCLLEMPVDLPTLYSAVDSWFNKGRTDESKESLVHFQGLIKASRGKHGIAIPRETLKNGGIDPGDEYDVYLKKSTKAKKENGGQG